MDDLIEALRIFLKYENPTSPTHCEHDTLMVCISPDVIPGEDAERLEVLGFLPNYDHDCFQSLRFGSA